MTRTRELLLADFNLYRRYMFPETVFSNWQDEASLEFVKFYEQMAAGELPALLLSAPPQHGKSLIVIQFASWVIAKNMTSAQVCYASVSHSLCKKAIRNLRRIIFSNRFKRIFDTLIVSKNTDSRINFGDTGCFLATTVGGQIVGETLDLVIIDDPHKNRAESRSKVVKERVKDWFDNDVSTRLTKSGGILSIQTRWAVDDLYNHIELTYPDSHRINFKAINDEGQALFPELKPLAFLLKRKSAMKAVDWASLYQGIPTHESGEMLDIDAIRYYVTAPEKFKVKFVIADTASTAKNYSDYSVFGYFGITDKLDIYLLDYKRLQCETPALEGESLAFWKKCGQAQWFGIENKSSGIGLIQSLKMKSLPVKLIQRGSGQGIVDRALDYGSVITQGRYYAPEWMRNDKDVMTELIAFPNAPHDDFVSVLLDGLQEVNKLVTVENTTFTTNALKRLR